MRSLAAFLAISCSCLLLAACGGEGEATATRDCSDRADRVNTAGGLGSVSTGSADSTYVAWTDISPSTQGTRASYLGDEVTFVRWAAKARAQFYADAFGGVPSMTTDFPVQADFSVTKPAFDGNEDLADADRDCDAQSLKGPLEALAQKDPQGDGSSLLQTLAVTARFTEQLTDSVPYVALFTDGQVVEPSWDVRTQPLTQELRQSLVAEWAPQLAGLEGAHVFVVGIGRGVHMSPQQLTDVHAVLSDMLGEVHATLDVFGVRLAQGGAGS